MTNHTHFTKLRHPKPFIEKGINSKKIYNKNIIFLQDYDTKKNTEYLFSFAHKVQRNNEKYLKLKGAYETIAKSPDNFHIIRKLSDGKTIVNVRMPELDTYVDNVKHNGYCVILHPVFESYYNHNDNLYKSGEEFFLTNYISQLTGMKNLLESGKIQYNQTVVLIDNSEKSKGKFFTVDLYSALLELKENINGNTKFLNVCKIRWKNLIINWMI